MALTEQKIREMDAIAGVKTPTPLIPIQNNGKSRADEIRNMVQNRKLQTQSESGSKLDQFATGVAKGELSTLKGLGTLGAKIIRPVEKGADFIASKLTGKEAPPSLIPDIYTPGTKEEERASNVLEARTPAESIGKGAEQIAEFFIPASKVTQVEKILAAGATTGLLEKLTPIVGEKIAAGISKIGSLGTKMTVRAAEGGGVVAAQTGGDLDESGTAAAVSALFPAGGAILDSAKEGGKALAPKIINSLIKPLLKDFSYGKNPGRAVAELGITASSLDELASKIGDARKQIGERLGTIYRKASEVVGNRINLTPQVEKIDNAITEAAKGGKNNQGVVNRLQNIKDALLHEHTVSADGTIVKLSNTPRDLSSLTPEEAFQFKKMIGDMTQFTGNASDDKAVNSLLKDLYGGTKKELNTAVKTTDPEIEKLNEQYADLTSAEVASKYREKIDARQNLVTTGAAGLLPALIAALSTGGAAVPAILAGAGGVALERVMSSPTIKTNVAKWLMSSTPAEKEILFKASPALRGAILKTFTGLDL